MPSKESTWLAVVLGSAVMFASMSGLVLMGGALTQLALTGKKWSEEMGVVVMSGVSTMMISGVVMLGLAVLLGALGWAMSRRSSAPSPVAARRA
ncbi:MAG: hypothetical protein RLZZ387_1687 [Chloroflexota bacterium]|jgi:hypothetical protein